MSISSLFGSGQGIILQAAGTGARSVQIVAAGSTATLAFQQDPTIAVPGVEVGDLTFVSLSASATPGNLLLATPSVASADTITVKALTLTSVSTASYLVLRLV